VDDPGLIDGEVEALTMGVEKEKAMMPDTYGDKTPEGVSNHEPGPKCRREGCAKEGLPYTRYDGCCSLYCRDVHELDEKIIQLETDVRRLREDRRWLVGQLNGAMDGNEADWDNYDRIRAEIESESTDAR
jgi:hypothetical protein